MRTWKAYYKVEVIRDNNIRVNPEGCSCISFELLAGSSATINDQIPLTRAGTTTLDRIREFNNDPGVIISNSFYLRFTADDSENAILVVKTFFE